MRDPETDRLIEATKRTIHETKELLERIRREEVSFKESIEQTNETLAKVQAFLKELDREQDRHDLDQD